MIPPPSLAKHYQSNISSAPVLKKIAPNHNPFSTGVIIQITKQSMHYCGNPSKMDHKFLRSKFDLPPPKKQKQKHGSHVMTPTAHPSTLDPPAASHPKLLERDFSISFGSLNWAFATRGSRDPGGMLKRQVLILPTPQKKASKSFCICIDWFDPPKKRVIFLVIPEKCRGGKSSTGAWKKQGVFLSPKFHDFFCGIHG